MIVLNWVLILWLGASIHPVVLPGTYASQDACDKTGKAAMVTRRFPDKRAAAAYYACVQD